MSTIESHPYKWPYDGDLRPENTALIIIDMQTDFCGKGGYVRAIARDLGEALGCYAHVTTLRRVWSGPFDLDGAITLEEIEALAKSPELDERLLPLALGLADLPELPATAEGAAKMRNGNPGMVIASDVEFGDLAWASYQGEPVAVGTYKAGELHPSRVFNT